MNKKKTKKAEKEQETPASIYQLNLPGEHGHLLTYMRDHHLPDWQFNVCSFDQDTITFDDTGGTQAQINFHKETVRLRDTKLKESTYQEKEYTDYKEATAFITSMVLFNKGATTLNKVHSTPTARLTHGVDQYAWLEGINGDTQKIVKLHNDASQDNIDQDVCGFAVHSADSNMNLEKKVSVYITMDGFPFAYCSNELDVPDDVKAALMT